MLRSEKIRDLLVLNDEAHHIHDKSLAWFRDIEDISNKLKLKNGNGESIQVFPNPAQDQINVQFLVRNLNTTAELFLCNSYGQIVFKQAIENTQARISMRVSGFPKGVYFLSFKTENYQLYHQKIVLGLK